MDKLLQDHPALQTARAFALDMFELFHRDTTMEKAEVKRSQMLANALYVADAHLAHALKKLHDDSQFKKMMTYTDYLNLNRTNNDVERMNRWMRKKLKAHYRLRRTETIGNAIALRMLEPPAQPALGSRLKLRPRSPLSELSE